MKRLTKARSLFWWLVAVTLLALPLPLLLLAINRDFNGDFALPEKAILAVGGFIAIVISVSKEWLGPNSSTEIRSSIGWLVVSLLLLFFCGLLKVLLFDAWRGGDFSSGFSPRDFDVAVSSFLAAAYKPFSWLRWVLFGGGMLAWVAFARGAFKFLRLLFPRLSDEAKSKKA